ncbi:acyltransferase family protein [Loktanella salsilacus]|uniref:acyltransferase family protein n=1 Tax=Loktanella salsilacus TaxID=195913 RepID=UPI003735868E
MIEVNKTRNSQIDFVKGILIWLVVLGHTLQYIKHGGDREFFSDTTFSFIYLFHMPLFMAVSGYLLKPVGHGGLVPLIKRRGAQIVVPMLVWVLITFVMQIVMDLFSNSFDSLALTKILVISLVSQYWFLWAVFLSTIFLYILGRAGRYEWFAATLLSMILVLLPLHQVPAAALTLVMLSFVFPFFLAGHAFARFDEILKRIMKSSYFFAVEILAWLVTLALWILWKPGYYSYLNLLDFVEEPYSVSILFTGGVFSSVAVALGIRRLYPFLAGTSFAAWIEDLGRKSLSIYLTQTFVFVVIARYLSSGWPNMGSVIGLLTSFAFSIGLVLALQLLTSFGSAKFNPVLFGAKAR